MTIRTIEVRDGASVLRFRLQFGIQGSRWRLWIAEHAFRAGARVLGHDIKLVREDKAA